MSSSQTTPNRFTDHAEEIARGRRFAFGRNWKKFLAILDEERIVVAEFSLRNMLGVETLTGVSFLDIGSGSGLLSLAARRLGAHVHSFDFDPDSIACTRALKQRFFPDDPEWTIEEASVLDSDYLQSLGTYDVVYSWGVLHQTGDMWRALSHVASLVDDGGRLFISIYNDQGGKSRRWRWIKRCYNRLPFPVPWLIILIVAVYWETHAALARLARLNNPLPFHDWQKKKRDRGMSVWHDLIDWVGGYPFEVAKPEQIFNFFYQQGFTLMKLHTDGCGHGCNEFVFHYQCSPKTRLDQR